MRSGPGDDSVPSVAAAEAEELEDKDEEEGRTLLADTSDSSDVGK